jgi:hypothetical protein
MPIDIVNKTHDKKESQKKGMNRLGKKEDDKDQGFDGCFHGMKGVSRPGRGVG